MATSPLKGDRVRISNHVHPKKLLLSKWTAVQPTLKEKHFWVTKVIEPDIPGGPVVEVELEAAMSGRVVKLAWRALKDPQHWLRGWL